MLNRNLEQLLGKPSRIALAVSQLAWGCVFTPLAHAQDGSVSNGTNHNVDGLPGTTVHGINLCEPPYSTRSLDTINQHWVDSKDGFLWRPVSTYEHVVGNKYCPLNEGESWEFVINARTDMGVVLPEVIILRYGKTEAFPHGQNYVARLGEDGYYRVFIDEPIMRDWAFHGGFLFGIAVEGVRQDLVKQIFGLPTFQHTLRVPTSQSEWSVIPTPTVDSTPTPSAVPELNESVASPSQTALVELEPTSEAALDLISRFKVNGWSVRNGMSSMDDLSKPLLVTSVGEQGSNGVNVLNPNHTSLLIERSLADLLSVAKTAGIQHPVLIIDLAVNGLSVDRQKAFLTLSYHGQDTQTLILGDGEYSIPINETFSIGIGKSVQLDPIIKIQVYGGSRVSSVTVRSIQIVEGQPPPTLSEKLDKWLESEEGNNVAETVKKILTIYGLLTSVLLGLYGNSAHKRRVQKELATFVERMLSDDESDHEREALNTNGRKKLTYRQQSMVRLKRLLFVLEDIEEIQRTPVSDYSIGIRNLQAYDDILEKLYSNTSKFVRFPHEEPLYQAVCQQWRRTVLSLATSIMKSVGEGKVEYTPSALNELISYVLEVNGDSRWVNKDKIRSELGSPFLRFVSTIKVINSAQLQLRQLSNKELEKKQFISESVYPFFRDLVGNQEYMLARMMLFIEEWPNELNGEGKSNARKLLRDMAERPQQTELA